MGEKALCPEIGAERHFGAPGFHTSAKRGLLPQWSKSRKLPPSPSTDTEAGESRLPQLNPAPRNQRLVLIRKGEQGWKSLDVGTVGSEEAGRQGNLKAQDDGRSLATEECDT